jgi:hypothetical protein
VGFTKNYKLHTKEFRAFNDLPEQPVPVDPAAVVVQVEAPLTPPGQDVIDDPQRLDGLSRCVGYAQLRYLTSR